MEFSHLPVLHLLLGAGFHGLYAAVISTLGWTMALFLVLQRLAPGRGWGQAFDFWSRILALSFALWALSGLSLWLHPAYDRQAAVLETTAAILVGVAIPMALLVLLVSCRYLLSSNTLLGVTVALAGLMSVLGLSTSAMAFRVDDGTGQTLLSFSYQDWLALSRSAMTTGMLLASVSALRCLFGDRQRDVRPGLTSGLLITALFSASTLAILGYDPISSDTGGTLAYRTKILVAVLVLASALATLLLLSSRRDSPDGRRLPKSVLGGFALLGVLAWIVVTVSEVALRSGAPLIAAEQGQPPAMLAFAAQTYHDLPTFVTYSVLYAGLTMTYLAGLGLMARAQARSRNPAFIPAAF